MAETKKPPAVGVGRGSRIQDHAWWQIASETTEIAPEVQPRFRATVVFPDCLARVFQSDAERRAFLREGAR